MQVCIAYLRQAFASHGEYMHAAGGDGVSVNGACVEVSKEPTAGHADDPDLQRSIVGTNERDSWRGVSQVPNLKLCRKTPYWGRAVSQHASSAQNRVACVHGDAPVLGCTALWLLDDAPYAPNTQPSTPAHTRRHTRKASWRQCRVVCAR